MTLSVLKRWSWETDPKYGRNGAFNITSATGCAGNMEILKNKCRHVGSVKMVSWFNKETHKKFLRN